MALPHLGSLAFLLLLLLAGPSDVEAVEAGADAGWSRRFTRELVRIDARTEGKLGVYIKRLKDGTELSYQAERPWYLASTTKVPVAIALLQKVEEGALSLQDPVTLTTDDYVDGAGDLQFREPGSRFTAGELLERMLTQSDSTAADILIRLVGEEELNARVRDGRVATGFHRLTSLLQVRKDVYAELHPRARELGNRDFIELKKARGLRARLRAFMARLGLRQDELKAQSLEEAFDRYYQRGLNSAPLKAYGGMLERLARGELLSPEHTELLLGHMEAMTTGKERIKAGLPKAVRFAQKTGTQVRRLCNVGVLRPERSGSEIVIASCLEGFTDQAEAERALRDVGAGLTKTGVLDSNCVRVDTRPIFTG
ncbi:MAG: class A beta-lactamase-related serine hydrolase [Oligoflexia bacterium]|nr:class A beta-lactamase-related serine hydrolase [Oligoflexia bacterium]